MGTGDWFRVRLGIGRPPGQQDPADFVLRPFSSAEQPDMLAQRGADAVESLVVSGLAGTQNEFNS
jgi:PTH1 family peptidyl-tRNA hydrolase